MTLLGLLTIVGGRYVGWNLGANDGANSMGTAVGAGVRKMREAVLIVAVFGFLGAVTMGSGVIKTIGRGIVPLDTVAAETATLIAISAMFGAGAWLTLATYLGLPVSTTHSTVGAVAGAGLAAGGVPIIWAKLGEIFVAWINSYRCSHYRLRSVPVDEQAAGGRKYPSGLGWLLTLSGIYGFFVGANDVAMRPA